MSDSINDLDINTNNVEDDIKVENGHYYLLDIITHQIQPLYQKSFKNYKANVAFETSANASGAIALAGVFVGATSALALPLLIGSVAVGIPAFLIFGYEYLQLNHLKDTPEQRVLIIVRQEKNKLKPKYFCHLSKDSTLHRITRFMNMSLITIDNKEFVQFSQDYITKGKAVANVLLSRPPIDLGKDFDKKIKPGIKGLFKSKTRKYSIADKINEYKELELEEPVKAYTKKKGGRRTKRR